MIPRRKLVVAVVLVALVTLAGCTSGPSGDSSGDDRTTAATDVASTTTTATLDDLTYPDGASDEAVENATALAESHVSTIADRGYVVEIDVSHSFDGESGTSTYIVEHDAETGETYERSSAYGGERALAYANGSGVYEKRGTDDVAYEVRRTETGDDLARSDIVTAVRPLLRAGEFEDPRVASWKDRTLVEYRLDDVANDTRLFDPETVTNASGSVFVDEQGVVHRVSVNVTQRVDGTEQRTQFEYRVSKLGDVDVEKPDWVSEAVERHESDDDSGARVLNRVQVVSAFGNVTESERVDRVTLTVMRAARSDDVDLSTATVEWIGPETATTLTYGERASANRFAVEAIKDPDGSVPVLDGQDDRFAVVLDASEIGGELEEGQAAQLKITTESGAVTIYRITVPTSLAGESAVTV